MADDSELLRQLRRGDQAALRALLGRHARYLYGIAHALVGNAHDAEDVMQETLIAATTSHFRGESSVKTWLVRILMNRVAMLRRSEKRRRGAMDRAKAERLPSPASSGAGGVDAKIDLTAMLSELSNEHREVIVLRELEGLSYEEMAAALGVRRGTVESRLHRAREELRKRFKGY